MLWLLTFCEDEAKDWLPSEEGEQMRAWDTSAFFLVLFVSQQGGLFLCCFVCFSKVGFRNFQSRGNESLKLRMEISAARQRRVLDQGAPGPNQAIGSKVASGAGLGTRMKPIKGNLHPTPGPRLQAPDFLSWQNLGCRVPSFFRFACQKRKQATLCQALAIVALESRRELERQFLQIPIIP